MHHHHHHHHHPKDFWVDPRTVFAQHTEKGMISPDYHHTVQHNWFHGDDTVDHEERIGVASRIVEKRSFSYYFFSVIYIGLTISFLALCIYTLATVNNNANAVELCGRDLWTILLLHITLPFLLTFVFIISTMLISPFLLQCTHKNPFCLFFIPLTILIAYNGIMLGMGIRFILDAEKNKEGCVAALTEASKGASPDLPLLIVLSWVYVGLDSISLLGGTCSFIFLICVQMNFMVSEKTYLGDPTRGAQQDLALLPHPTSFQAI
jgi:hypothetical protein